MTTDPARTAHLDQALAGMRDWATQCGLVRDEFVRADFTTDEAFILLERVLDRLEGLRCASS